MKTQADVAAPSGGTNGADLTDALTAAIKDPEQPDAVRYWACALRYLLTLTCRWRRANEEAALEAVVNSFRNATKTSRPVRPSAD